MELLQNFYETTLDALKEAKNERLWFKTNTKLGKLYYDREDYNKLQKILKQLHLSCQVNTYLFWLLKQYQVTIEGEFEDTKWEYSESLNQRTDNTTAKRKRTKVQTTSYKIVCVKIDYFIIFQRSLQLP